MLVLAVAPRCAGQRCERVSRWLDGIQWGAEYSSALPLDVDNDGLPEAVIALNDGFLHALNADGSEAEGWVTPIPGQDPYPGLGPIGLGYPGDPFEGWATVAAGDLDPFVPGLELVVGSPTFWQPEPPPSKGWAYLFHSDGSPLYTSEDTVGENRVLMNYRTWNSAAVADCNKDGSLEAHIVDECCRWRMFDGVGKELQEGMTGDVNAQVLSSPAIGFVGFQRSLLDAPPEPIRTFEAVVVGSTDYIRDRPREGRFPLQQLWAFDTKQSEPPGDGVQVQYFPKGYPEAGHPENLYWITSSPALADFDGDRIEDVVVGCDDDIPGEHGGSVRVFYYARDGQGVPREWSFPRDPAVYDPPGGPGHPEYRPGISEEYDVWARWIASPAIAPLEGPGSKTVVIGGDDGMVRAFHMGAYDQCSLLWYRRLGSYPIQAGVAIADVTSVWPGLEVVVPSDDGRVYMLDGATGNVLWIWDCRDDPGNRQPEDAVRTTPLITDLDGDGVADIIVANDWGLFKLNYPGQWDPNNAPWPMFRRDVCRRGNYDTYGTTTAEGSINGRIFFDIENDERAFDPVNKVRVDLEDVWYGQHNDTTYTRQDGRYIFDRVPAGAPGPPYYRRYRIRATWAPPGEPPLVGETIVDLYPGQRLIAPDIELHPED
jgi:hypothetical protein